MSTHKKSPAHLLHKTRIASTTESGAAHEVAKEEVAKEEQGVALERIKASAIPPGDEAGSTGPIEPSQKEEKEQQKATKKAKTSGAVAGSASSFGALVLIGVAAAICAAAIPQMTAKPCGASKPPEAQHAVACSTQWLPVLLSLSSRPHRSTYFRRAWNHSQVEGWFGAQEPVDVLLSTMVNGGMEGSLIEIGVFRGKSFIHMARHMTAGQVYPSVAIDAFSMQESNLDGAGVGVKEIVLRNVRQHLPTELHEQVKIVGK